MAIPHAAPPTTLGSAIHLLRAACCSDSSGGGEVAGHARAFSSTHWITETALVADVCAKLAGGSTAADVLLALHNLPRHGDRASAFEVLRALLQTNRKHSAIHV